MATLVVKDITVYYADVLILDKVSLQLSSGEKVALIGQNGTGKTTLLKVIASKLRPEEGAVMLSGDARVHYLDQQPSFEPGTSLFAAVSEVFAPLREMEAELRSLEAQMSGADGLDKIMRRYAKLTDEYEMRGGYEYESRVKTVLAGVGFQEKSFTQDVVSLSGGQKVRAALAKALLEEPEVLLLDEPTNHLDLEAVEWLESFMPGYRGAVLLVSHDRHFLDKVVTRCIELENHRTTEYTGNFSKYRALKAQNLAGTEERYVREQAEMKRMGKWISKFKAGTRSTMAKSMEKKLARIASNAVERPRQKHSLRLSVSESRRSGRDVLALKDFQVGYDGNMLFAPFSAEVKRGERLALLGANGSGKTSLLRALMGKLEHRGQARFSPTAEVGYFDQQLNLLRPAGRVIDEIMAYAPLTENEARSYLARFLFRGELVWQSVSTLSGGERNRLNMAKLLISGFNVLLLDEPTNHLDIESREALEWALLAYTGTIIFVSHDRYFLNKLATRLWQIDKGRIVDHRTNYSNWRQLIERPSASPAQRSRQPGSVAARGDTALQNVEREIERLEKEKVEFEEQMASRDFFNLPEGGKSIVTRYNRVCSRLRDLYEQWERLAH